MDRRRPAFTAGLNFDEVVNIKYHKRQIKSLLALVVSPECELIAVGERGVQSDEVTQGRGAFVLGDLQLSAKQVKCPFAERVGGVG